MKKVILKQEGKFVNVYGDDAIIVSYLLNYKLVNNKVGFPISALNKVINILEEKNISYEVKAKDELVKNFKNNNKYDIVFEKAKEVIKLRNRYQTIETYFDSLSIKQLDKIISYIEKVINE